jgi:hypothetical protein
MTALSTKTKHYYRERVRSLLVQDPMISGEGMRRHLERRKSGTATPAPNF